jgi:hypothetical protein
MRLVSDADRARSVLRRSPTPLSEKVASLFGSRAPLCNEHADCNEHAGRRRAVRSKRSRSHRGIITGNRAGKPFPDTSRAMSKFIVTYAIPDDQQTPRPVRAALPERARS